MQSSRIRQEFLKYFEGLAHVPVPSARLVPEHDPTLFFVNAGMVPFKRYFTGEERPPYRRAVSSQKCLRVSGKHNDLENVGVTARHHTFFEMLGNFSFGDYFKKEAIAWGWEFLTKVCGLGRKDLWITVYKDDEEAAAIWRKDIGVAADRIVRLGEKDNFWSMGPTGPCGPCSEIHLDRGGICSLNNPACSVDCDCDRFMEIWNLVFMQYNRDTSGKMTPLPKPSIDTGMGLERLTMILQGKASNYDTDLFQPLIAEISRLTGKRYGGNEADNISMRVLADHARAMSFLIADGVLPSNEGQGYVLRRIMRRAIRHGRLLGMNTPFFYKLHDVLVAEMGGFYRELADNAAFVKKVAKAEEERFLETLDKGTALLDAEMRALKEASGKTLPGGVVFKLYDTFGFPADLTEIILRENDLALDWEGFEAAMQVQKDQGREARKEMMSSGAGAGSGRAQVYAQLKEKLSASRFTGYGGTHGEGTLLAILKEGKEVPFVQMGAKAGDEVECILDATPFYPEGGGQVGDRGVLEKLSGHRPREGEAPAEFTSAGGGDASPYKGAKIEVVDTRRVLDSLIIHRGKVISGAFAAGDTVTASVEVSERRATMKNHTATHLLHAALRRHLGEHVKQAGSLVDSRRLRFDFSHFEPVPRQVLRAIEDEINAKIQEDIALFRDELDYDEAMARGALAFFGEKYGKRVRMVQVGDYSTELCGGTHVARTGEIGLFKVASEAGIASGVRRIEAVTGPEALAYVHRLEDLCGRMEETLKTDRDGLPDRLEKLQSKTKTLEKEVEGLRTRLALGNEMQTGAKPPWRSQVKDKNGVTYLVFETGLDDPESLRALSDKIRSELASAVVLLIGKNAEKILLLASVSKDLAGKYHAGKIIQTLSPLVGGKGGGRPDFAQGGGTDFAALPRLISAFEGLI